MQSKTDDKNFNESQGQKGCGLFYVTEQDLELIDIESLLNDKKYTELY